MHACVLTQQINIAEHRRRNDAYCCGCWCCCAARIRFFTTTPIYRRKTRRVGRVALASAAAAWIGPPTYGVSTRLPSGKTPCRRGAVFKFAFTSPPRCFPPPFNPSFILVRRYGNAHTPSSEWWCAGLLLEQMQLNEARALCSARVLENFVNNKNMLIYVPIYPWTFHPTGEVVTSLELQFLAFLALFCYF